MKSEVQIPWSLLLRLAAFALLVAAVIHLAPLLLLGVMAILIALAVEPALDRMQRHMPRSVAATLVSVLMIGSVAAFVVWIVPPMVSQFNRVIEKAPLAGPSLLSHLPQRGLAQHLAGKLMDMPALNMEKIAPQILGFGQMALSALTSLVLIAALSIYLMADGASACRWILAYFKPAAQVKLRRTFQEVMPVVSSYIVGQFITSVLCSLFVYFLLRAHGVPAALLLAVTAGIFDVLPIIGFFMAAVPSVFFALTVSPHAALMVFLLFGVYHMLENYVIVPMVYGKRLRVSGLMVLVAILVGAGLGGIIGAIVALPLIASYPIVERIWLSQIVGTRAVAVHAAQMEDATPAAAHRVTHPATEGV